MTSRSVWSRALRWRTIATSAVLIGGVLMVMLSAESKPPETKTTPAASVRDAQAVALLRKKCFGCHGAGKDLEGELDLRTRTAMLKGGNSGPAVVSGKPERSSVYTAVLRKGDLVMPPKERNKLTKDETELLRAWIIAGAKWPDTTSPKVTESKSENSRRVAVATSGGLSPDWSNRKYIPQDLWAYQPVQRYPVPKIAGTTHPVDAFIRRKLAEQKFAPAKPADKVTLIRRVTFDLTGLPPSPQEIEAFVKDDSPRAYDALITRLLNSPQYGEQQARHWLDVVRYADTAGFSNDFERPNAWRFRDYVIRSFNADKPFDRFLVEQIAGDELDPNNPELAIAVGFLRMGPWEHTGMSVAAITRQQYLDDITNSVGVTFLAHSLRCAQCHDHKFDPIPTRDYYRIQAVFAPVQFTDRNVPYRKSENIRSFATTRPRIERLLKDAREFIAALRKKHNDAVAAFLKKRGVKSLQEIPEPERPLRHYGLTQLEYSLQKIYQKRISYFERELKRYDPLAFSVYSGPPRFVQSNKARHPLPPPKQRRGKSQEIHILAGGSLAAPLDAVTPGVLTAVAFSNDKQTPTAWNTIPNATHGRRLAFARWLASPNNTLTARVIVNRIWQQHFGTGLVATPNNFGKMGAKPSHPELLDWLTTWFIDHGWSIKKLHRLIVTSATYRQSSRHAEAGKLMQTDPKNRLLAYMSPRRMTAEELRDAMLAVTGELSPERGGPGVYPEINWEVAIQPRHIMGSVAPTYQPSRTRAERNRRTIYAFRYRTLADPLLEVFNRPNSETSCERRDETTVTPQVFALFNGQFVHDRATALAARIAKSAKEPEEQISAAFRSVYGRFPSDTELKLSRDHLAAMTKHHRTHKPKIVNPPTEVTREMIEELTGEKFTWTEKLDLMKNYEPDLKPWNVPPETRALAELCLVLLNSNEFVYLR